MDVAHPRVRCIFRQCSLSTFSCSEIPHVAHCKPPTTQTDAGNLSNLRWISNGYTASAKRKRRSLSPCYLWRLMSAFDPKQTQGSDWWRTASSAEVIGGRSFQGGLECHGRPEPTPPVPVPFRCANSSAIIAVTQP